MKLIEPWMPGRPVIIEEDPSILFEAKEQDEKLAELLLKKVNTEGEDFSTVCFSKTRFENCCFPECSFHKCEFTDVIFRACNFSNCDFTETYFNRCCFLNSKGLGANFSGSSIQNMTIGDCCMNYANFDDCRLEKVRIENTELNTGNISQCRCKNVEWEGVQLNHASFFKTFLYGMDFTTCSINGLVLTDDCRELKGAVVDLYQAAELAKRLGIVIKEQKDN